MYDNVGRHYISFLNVSDNDIYGEGLTTYWFMYFQKLWAINLKTAHKHGVILRTFVSSSFISL